ncbi:MAG: LL-diaminopimelate aminotransferase [Clostridia bacterium]|jgi:LL-diaminopimelate aminotransferase|nr:LL-diaminopimelate aminotransferase [Clostridia bacterium]
MQEAKRLEALSGGIFTEIDNLSKQIIGEGVRVVNLSIGSPDLPPSLDFRKILAEYVMDPANYGYALTDGLPEFRTAVANWYYNRDQIVLDPQCEVLPLMGSQDGLSHIYWGFLNKGDIALIPDPGYPIYKAGVLLTEAIPYPMPLTKENNFLPDLTAIPPEIAHKAKIMLINYPSNPLAATATYEFFIEIVDFARKYNIIVCHDFAYSELAYDGFKPISFLSVPGAREIGIEFHSLSKTYNLAGCRLGFAVGNKDIINTLRKIKTNIDFGSFKAILKAGAYILTGSQESVRKTAQTYQNRRDILIEGLNKIGWSIPKPKASMFIWAPIPENFKSSYDFTKVLAFKTGVIVVPGVAFGEQGEGYVRIGLVQPEILLEEAVTRISTNFDKLKPPIA